MSTDDRQTTEKAILDAAETLFMERGFATTSTTDIAKRAGCNQALIHYYYRTKDKLFEAIFRRKAPVFLAAFFRSDLKDLPFEERMRRRVETHFDLLLENPRVPFLVINEIFVNPGRLEAYVPLFRDTLKSAAADLQAELDEEYGRAGSASSTLSTSCSACSRSISGSS
jgi:AcrR family transcriptional regulator